MELEPPADCRQMPGSKDSISHQTGAERNILASSSV